ncbi:CocE/NonD family hydrolase [Acidobacteriota bacterium]
MTKNTKLSSLVIVTVALFLFIGFSAEKPSQTEYKVKYNFNVRIPMSDGVELSADMYMPDSEGKFPAILVRTPYDNNNVMERKDGHFFAKNGYIYITQDVRGRGDSDGEFYPFIDEVKDGHDTYEWIGKQEWSNGKVGSKGGSYLGWTQVFAATMKSDFYTAMIPQVTPPDPFLNFPIQNGSILLTALQWAVLTDGNTLQDISIFDWEKILKHLPLVDMDKLVGREFGFWTDWLTHYTWDEYWDELSYQEKLAKVDIPAIHMTGWYDDDQPGCIQNFMAMHKHAKTIGKERHQKLIVGPWPHAFNRSKKMGRVDYGRDSIIDMNALYLRWFGYWLKGKETGVLDDAPVKIFVMGDNVWRDEQEWPLKRTAYTKYYFHSEGKANTLLGDGKLSTVQAGSEKPDKYVYDPAKPVTFIFKTFAQMGMNEDQRPIEEREDVLCYTSDVLAEDVEVTGPLTVKLYISSDVTDTDFFARLVDVHPDEYAMRVADNITKTRFRNTFRKAEPIVPGKVYELEIDLWCTSLVFKKGHRIRVEVTSSAFPLFNVNRNTGDQFGFGTEMKIANQTVYHTSEYPSHIVLPIIPREE